MTYTIDRRFLVDEGTEFEHNVGAYVRKIGEDMGTGWVIARAKGEALDPKTSTIKHSIEYIVQWLDKKTPTGNVPTDRYAQSELAASARGVPKFDSPEEAEQWMEQQLQGGNWTTKAQDAVDARSDWDIGLQELTEEGS